MWQSIEDYAVRGERGEPSKRVVKVTGSHDQPQSDGYKNGYRPKNNGRSFLIGHC
jgi:hypothetical protein